MSIYTPGCANPPSIVCNDCFGKELGGVRGVWLQKPTFAFIDITDPSEWEAAICNKDVYVFPYTNGDAAMDPNTSSGYGNTPLTTDSFTYTVTFHEPNLVVNGSGANGNLPFWSFMNNSSTYLIGWKTQSQVWLSSIAAQFTATTPIAADIKSKVDIMVKASFIQETVVIPVAAPATIWDSCVDC